jgi:hypothetical protein
MMQTALIKYNIISWITGLNDEKVIKELHQWVEKQESEALSTEGVVPPRRKGSLTEGFGFWAEDAPFTETNYRDQLWQTEKNIW